MKSACKQKCILVVDDSKDTLEVIRRNLAAAGYQVFTSTSVSEAVKFLGTTSVDLVITDLKMPHASGLDLVRHVRDNLRDAEVMMITGYSSVEGAVEAIKTGAEEYLAKPFTDEELLSAVRRALSKLNARSAGRISPNVPSMVGFGLIGDSSALRQVAKAISKAARSSATVLITGESGTGKELVARAIHYAGPHASAPFVPVNCGGIPEGLLEAELFGHVKGAFTGATEARAGFFHAADGGSIFLDEVSEMSMSMQVKFLRVLQDQHVYMVGSTRAQPVKARIVAATNKDLVALVRKGSFREDLFYRLNVLTINIPPLRERGDDILILTRHFLDRFSREMDKTPPTISERALSILRNYDWPGNVRELENVIHRLVIMTDGNKIDAPDLPTLMRFSALHTADLTRSLAEIESEYIRNVLASVGGNKARAAKILGVDRKTLREKLKRIESSSSGQEAD